LYFIVLNKYKKIQVKKLCYVFNFKLYNSNIVKYITNLIVVIRLICGDIYDCYYFGFSQKKIIKITQ
jgi:hypothetical protein